MTKIVRRGGLLACSLPRQYGVRGRFSVIPPRAYHYHRPRRVGIMPCRFRAEVLAGASIPGSSGRPILVLVAPVIDYQKHAAEMDVRKLLGVMGLSNQIAIKPSAQASDVRKGIGAAFERKS